LLQNDNEKKANLTEPSQGAKKKKLIQFLIFLCYELSACPLIFYSNKVYIASSLIAKPNLAEEIAITHLAENYAEIKVE
jgi:hypothetical protein